MREDLFTTGPDENELEERESDDREPDEKELEEKWEAMYSEGPRIELAFIGALVNHYKYDFEMTAADGELRFEVVTVSGKRWRTQALIHEKERLVRVYHFLDQLYPDEPRWRRWVAEAVHLLNESVVLGAFECQRKGGGVVYRNSADVSWVSSLYPAIVRLLDSSAFALDLCERTFKRMGEKGITPWDAICFSKAETRTLEAAARISPAVLKKLLKVEDGGGNGRRGGEVTLSLV